MIFLARSGEAQQRPLLTEEAETVGAGRLLIEAGFDYGHDQEYPVSGLEGNLLRFPLIGLSVGISSIAELQIDGGFYNRLSITDRSDAPLSSLVTATGDTTSDVEDFVVATKIRFARETSGRPALGVRFATKLPNASNESGLGLDTTDFYATFLAGKTVRSIRIVGNAGLGILADPTQGDRQNDVFTYGVSVARAVAQGFEIVGEANGRLSTRSGEPPPGTESRSVIRVGARYLHGAGRVDGGVQIGLTSNVPDFAFLAGYTYVFNAFLVP